MPADKAREIVKSLGPSHSDPVSFLLGHRLVSATERKRLGKLKESSLEKVGPLGIQALTLEQFGPDLAAVPAPPICLFARGDVECLKRTIVSIVGTRGASTYGKAVARKFAQELSRAGAIVASGGALGIDAQAHEGALEVGGKTVVALACGVDVVQPPKHKQLFEQVVGSGCLVSPYAIGAPSLQHHFRTRNNLLAAMSAAVIVIEAPQASGALMSSSAAADLGRPVFVVPGPISDRSYVGSHELIRDGATLVYHPDQVLETLDLEASSPEPDLPQASGIQADILNLLGSQSLSPEAIVEKLGLDSSEVMSELTLMELEGMLIRDGQGYSLKP